MTDRRRQRITHIALFLLRPQTSTDVNAQNLSSIELSVVGARLTWTSFDMFWDQWAMSRFQSHTGNPVAAIPGDVVLWHLTNETRISMYETAGPPIWIPIDPSELRIAPSYY